MSVADHAFAFLRERDPETAGHCLRVHSLSLKLARRLGWRNAACADLSIAAKLHDIGKVSLPETILNKPGRLTSVEATIMREHPLIGERVLRPIIANPTILAAIRGHHERFDGRGYPDNLCGEEIPLAARVIALADCFDALTHARAYRPARPLEEARRILQDGAGTQFDPRLTAIFLQIEPCALV